MFEFSKLARQAVGDGVADLLAIEAVLSRSDMSIGGWLHLYSRQSSCNMTAHEADKSVISTTDFERRVEEPIVLQKANAYLREDDGWRAFVRPSGTEDIVQV